MVALAKTQAFDVWIWFPLGVGVNRLLTRNGRLQPGWEERLTLMFGSDDWQSRFYVEMTDHTFFGTSKRKVKVVSPEAIAGYYAERLATVFPHVAEPALLRNSKNNPIYALCFAAANPKGGQIALKIARHLLSRI